MLREVGTGRGGTSFIRYRVKQTAFPGEAAMA